ncbi:MAG TPA: NAD(P)/FAD-dependent oxidoreductase [Solirubrobacteraceae bacterium]|nr:NAD(P)/FAD-dependent oxidoreductase [Solirubrobacteraceae bacterium]
MADAEQGRNPVAGSPDYDAVIVGASLAGSATSMLLARAGARVALVEKRADPGAFKRICSHFIQSSAIAAIERLGLLDAMLDAGGLRTRPRIWTRWGWIHSPAGTSVPSGLNLRREVMDPLVRAAAADTPGVELIQGWTAEELLHEHGRTRGLVARNPQGESLRLRAPLVVGADGRDSRVAVLAAVPSRTLPHRRFAYARYYEGPAPDGAPDASLWMLDPQWAAAFPTDEGLTTYAAMPTKERLGEFRRDPAAALSAFIADLPEPPPILASRPASKIFGKLEMPNVMRAPTAPGLALVGDAALATDPLWGVGCGWAFQSAEWLADSVGAAVGGAESLEQGLERYRRRHTRALKAHAFMIHDYASGRKMNPGERTLFAGAVRDAGVAEVFEAFGSRNIGPARFMAEAMPRAIAANVRHALSGRPRRSTARVGLEHA